MADFRVPLHAEILQLKPYVPGKPIEELERELGISGAVKLASNENPLGPSPKAMEAMAACLSDLHRYPDGSAYRLRRALSGRLGRDETRLILGNGSNELLVLLAECVLDRGDEVLFADPGFVVYRLAAQWMGATPKPLPLKAYTHDLEAFVRAWTPRTRLVFICNPNNPTGTIVPLSAVERFMEKTSPETLVVLDEAYYEYVDEPSYFESLDLLDRYPNLAVLRTFSKVHGLAGLRVGYGLVHPVLADAVQRARQPFNVNRLALEAAEAALGDGDHVRRVTGLNRRMRSRLSEGLRAMGREPAPSQANFVYFREADAVRVYERLLAKGVIVRPMGPEALRVTTGTEEETERFLKAFAEVTRS